MADAIRRPILHLNIPVIVPAPAPVPVRAPPRIAMPRAVVGNDDVSMRAILRTVDFFAGEEITEAEIRRGYAMIAAHNTTPRSVLDTILCLDRPPLEMPPILEMVPGDRRRVDLAAMLGIAIGFERVTAQSLIDKSRSKKLEEVVPFLAKEVAIISLTGASVYGACWLVRGGVAGVGAKITAVKAGSVSIAGAVGTAAAVVSMSALTVGAGVAGAFFLVLGACKVSHVVSDHRDLIEPRFFKDQRILQGIKEGVVLIPNPAPRAREAV